MVEPCGPPYTTVGCSSPLPSCPALSLGAADRITSNEQTPPPQKPHGLRSAHKIAGPLGALQLAGSGPPPLCPSLLPLLIPTLSPCFLVPPLCTGCSLCPGCASRLACLGSPLHLSHPHPGSPLGRPTRSWCPWCPKSLALYPMASTPALGHLHRIPGMAPCLTSLCVPSPG